MTQQTSTPLDPAGQDGLAEALCHVLAATCRLAIRTSVQHWNASGRDAAVLRNICDRQREELWCALDPIAHRIHMLGGWVGLPPDPDAPGWTIRADTVACPALLAAHHALIEDIRAALDIARAYDDETSVGLLRMRLLAHDRHVWELAPLGDTRPMVEPLA